MRKNFGKTKFGKKKISKKNYVFGKEIKKHFLEKKIEIFFQLQVTIPSAYPVQI